MSAEIVLAIVGLAIQYGVPAVQSAFTAYGKEVITMEDIQALKLLIKKPDEY